LTSAGRRREIYKIQDVADLAKPAITGFFARETAMQNQIVDRATQLERNARFMLQETDSWQKKASIQIRGLFNLIVQRDPMANVDISRTVEP
jgi:hypothetical protein